MDHLPILSMLSFAEQKFLILLRFSSSIIFRRQCLFGISSKKSSPQPQSARFFSCLHCHLVFLKYNLGTSICLVGFQDGSVVKNLPANAAEVGSSPRIGIFPGQGNGNPLQCSCLGNPMDRGAWWVTVHRVTKSQTPLSD